MPIPAGPFMTQQLHSAAELAVLDHAGTKYPEEPSSSSGWVHAHRESPAALAMTVPGHLLPPLQSVPRWCPSTKRTS